jgi:ribosomal protein S18 acetylase RimI-like enzyme
MNLADDRLLGHPEVIETSDGVVGVVDFAMTGDHAELSRISIHPDHHNLGLGTAVLTALLRRADEQDLPVHLEVFDINPARRLYERLGFSEVWRDGRQVGMLRPAQPLG